MELDATGCEDEDTILLTELDAAVGDEDTKVLLVELEDRTEPARIRTPTMMLLLLACEKVPTAVLR